MLFDVKVSQLESLLQIKCQENTNKQQGSSYKMAGIKKIISLAPFHIFRMNILHNLPANKKPIPGFKCTNLPVVRL